LQKAAEYRIKIAEDSPQLHKILESLKELENQGYQFEGAEASFELLMKKATGHYQRFFDLLGYRVIAEKRGAAGPEFTGSEASVMVKVGSNTHHNAALGNGPVNALDNALHKCLYSIYPQLRDIKLLDYKVRVLSAGEGTASRVRVLIEWGDGQRKWGTVGVSENVIEASCQALVDSYEYKLLKELQPNSDNSV
jgi:2-isopropylmalate synthase